MDMSRGRRRTELLLHYPGTEQFLRRRERKEFSLDSLDSMAFSTCACDSKQVWRNNMWKEHTLLSEDVSQDTVRADVDGQGSCGSSRGSRGFSGKTARLLCTWVLRSNIGWKVAVADAIATVICENDDRTSLRISVAFRGAFSEGGTKRWRRSDWARR